MCFVAHDLRSLGACLRRNQDLSCFSAVAVLKIRFG